MVYNKNSAMWPRDSLNYKPQCQMDEILSLELYTDTMDKQSD